MTEFAVDRLVFTPDDIDLERSPLAGLGAETFVLGAFNPGLTRLPNGNLLMMVRVAEALRDPIFDGHIHAIRWNDGRYLLDAWKLDQVDTSDPRKFLILGGRWRVMALTSLSWLLPVELTSDGLHIVETGEPTESSALANVVNLASWADEERTALAPHQPEVTDVVVELEPEDSDPAP